VRILAACVILLRSEQVMEKIIRIGGASGFWGDSSIATPQLLTAPIDYLVYDYLAETTMSIMARARAKDANMGCATDFVTVTMTQDLKNIASRGVKVLSNAGGLNPRGCRDALMAIAREQGIDIKVAVVTGDDVMALLPILRSEGIQEMFSGLALPDKIQSANAYLGARGVSDALRRGAQIVITGRGVDSALLLGALGHEFQWNWRDWNRLAQASLAGHIVECGAQGSGGLFTDWQQVPDWDNIGYPIVECASDGSFVVTKPANTGGLVTTASVAEQILYEIGDPAEYVLPDVICDFRSVHLTADGEHRVRVTGATGREPTSSYKVSATFQDGYQLETGLAIRGIDAVGKAKKTADALLKRTRRMMGERGFADYADALVEIIGAESLYGPHARRNDAREVIMRIAVRHPDKNALEILRREASSPGTSMSPGTSGALGGGRADIKPVVRLFSFLLDKRRVSVSVDVDSNSTLLSQAVEIGNEWRPSISTATPVIPSLPQAINTISVPLIRIAHARSGDKGDNSNVGVIARSANIWLWLQENLTAEQVAAYMAHPVKGQVERYELPGIMALNFVLQRALGGGGMASLQSDPLGKCYAQMLLDMPVEIPIPLLGAGTKQ
jgi:Acyclic terpene utilisation family protein AtuA